MTQTSIEPRRKRGTKSDRYYTVNIWLSTGKQTIIEPRVKGDKRRVVKKVNTESF